MNLDHLVDWATGVQGHLQGEQKYQRLIEIVATNETQLAQLEIEGLRPPSSSEVLERCTLAKFGTVCRE